MIRVAYEHFAETMTVHLSISLLGSLQVTLTGDPVTGFATDKTRALLAYLAIEAGRLHRRDALAGLLWPDEPQATARRNLRQALLFLRQALDDQERDPPFLLVDRETIQFNVESDYWLDTTAFASLVDANRKHRHRDPQTCLPCMRRRQQIVDLYDGRFLDQFYLSDSGGFEEWALLQREWFHREAVEALAYLASYYERCGDYALARDCAWRQVSLDPWREEAHRQLIRLLALDGQRSAALSQYETCRRALGDALGVEPTAETVALYEQVRAGKSLGATAVMDNLPPLSTSFIDREVELGELSEMVANPDCRLVTLVGPGGIGKTRLALQVATKHVGAFDDGVYFVSLASIDSAEHLLSTIADALHILLHDQDPELQLVNYLRGKKMLLVLDNLEHVLKARTLLAGILRGAPGVVILATSRERIGLREEWVYEVRGLSYPQAEREEALAPFGAVELFWQRARQANQRFALTTPEMPYVAHICRLVEGMPLAIELAAAWTSVHSCQEIAEEIERDLDILTTRLHGVPERHQSIRATFEHSWRLLTAQEQHLLARLSVFGGGFTNDAATAVAGASLLTLSALLDKSLIRRVSHARYDMHELLRQYALEKLSSDSQGREQTYLAYVRYFADLLERYQDVLKLAKQKDAFREISLEIGNVRQAWHISVTHGWVCEAERMVNSLYHFHDVQGRYQEGIQLFGQAIDRWRGDKAQRRFFGRALARLGALCHHVGHYKRARDCLEQALAIWDSLEMRSERIFCLVHLASVASSQGRYEKMQQLAESSLALSRELEHCWGISFSLFLLGVVLYRKGEVDRSEALLQESLSVARGCGNQRRVIAPLNVLGDIACHRGDYVEAQRMFEECLRLSKALGDPFNAALQYNNLGTVFQVLEDYVQARHFYGQSLDICREIGDRSGQAIALSNIGEVAFALGEYHAARTLYLEGLSIGREIQDQWTIVNCLNNLGEISCALQDAASARGYFAEALGTAMKAQMVTVLLKVLVNLAECLARHDRPDRAAELLALACDHPAGEQAIHEKAQRLLNEMGPALPDGGPRPLAVVVNQILAEISIHP